MQYSAGACIALALLYSIVSLEPMRNKALYSGEAESVGVLFVLRGRKWTGRFRNWWEVDGLVHKQSRRNEERRLEMLQLLFIL